MPDPRPEPPDELRDHFAGEGPLDWDGREPDEEDHTLFCSHGIFFTNDCEECDEERRRTPEPGHPGSVRLTRGEIENPEAIREFAYLISHREPALVLDTGEVKEGPLFLPIHGDETFEPDTADDVRRLRGYCGLSLLELQERMAEASKVDMEDYERFGPLALFAILSARANWANHQEKRTFSWFKHGNERWLGTHVAIVAASGRGKGLGLDFITLIYGPVLEPECHVAEVVGTSVPGILGGHDPKKGGKFKRGAVQRAANGIVTFPEFGVLVGTLSGPNGTLSPGAMDVAQYLSSGRVARALLKGDTNYQGYDAWFGAIQTDAWGTLAASMIGITRRMCFTYLRDLTQEEVAARLEHGSDGFPLDPLALRVFRAKFRRIVTELQPSPLVLRAVESRLADLIRNPPDGCVFRWDDLQRWVALSLGYHLASGGNLRGEVVLADPWDCTVLKRVLSMDGRLRRMFDLDEDERLVQRIDDYLAHSGFMGTPEKPIARSVVDIQQEVAGALKASPGKVLKLLRGYGGGNQARSESFTERRILEQVQIVREGGGEPPEGAVVERRGRPSVVYRYVPVENRFHPPSAELKTWRGR